MSTMKEAVNKFFGRRINNLGQEVPDPTPVAMPLGHINPEPLEVRMRRMIQMEMSQEAMRQGYESFEEANDFNVGDGDDERFTDEDDIFTPNDPHVQNAFEREEPVVRERLTKAQKEAQEKKATEGRKAKAKPAPADDAEGDESE